jgi:hypothetical protein
LRAKQAARFIEQPLRWSRLGCVGEVGLSSDAFGHFFRLHALDARLDLGFGAGRRELERALAGHVLGAAELMGRDERWA